MALLATLWAVSCHLPIESPFLRGASLKGFEQKDPLIVYNRENIFDYLNGEAEVYLSFGFKRLYKQSYWKLESGGLVLVECYDMDSSEGARGVLEQYFAKQCSGISGLGESACTDTYIILFWRGRYFLRVAPDPFSDPELRPSLEVLFELSQALDKALKEKHCDRIKPISAPGV
ncbi:MAG: hypothetical protein JSW12_05395 [Deltaproteobacteria bacterium]|nr:MAG: hypothetical protein JSW12_05395 [Deltaproteobacteria bacterium]